MVLLLAVVHTDIACSAENIQILISGRTNATDDFLIEFKKQFADIESNGGHLTVSQIQAGQTLKELGSKDVTLYVAVGVQALIAANSLEQKQPVLGVFIPQLAFEKIASESKKASVSHALSAIYIDQPYPRQLELIHALIPTANKIGVLYSTPTLGQLISIKSSSNTQGFSINQELVSEPNELLSKLKNLLDSSDAILTIPDPSIYNRDTAESILLTSYRYQKPIIGFSQAYVKAGAIAAIYSSPRNIAQQTVELIQQFIATSNKTLLAPQYPKYFSIEVNYQVARALAIAVENLDGLHDAIARKEKEAP